MVKSLNAIYLRDGRAPIPKNENTSRVMHGNRGKDTKPELLLRRVLWKEGVRGYRLHWKKAPGRPDLAFPGKKIAVFVNGCFWHRCPHCNPPNPARNSLFWAEKFANNKKRDIRNQKALTQLKWHVGVIWECQIRNSLSECIKQIELLLNDQKKKTA